MPNRSSIRITSRSHTLYFASSLSRLWIAGASTNISSGNVTTSASPSMTSDTTSFGTTVLMGPEMSDSPQRPPPNHAATVAAKATSSGTSFHRTKMLAAVGMGTTFEIGGTVSR